MAVLWPLRGGLTQGLPAFGSVGDGQFRRLCSTARGAWGASASACVCAHCFGTKTARASQKINTRSTSPPPSHASALLYSALAFVLLHFPSLQSTTKRFLHTLEGNCPPSVPSRALYLFPGVASSPSPAALPADCDCTDRLQPIVFIALLISSTRQPPTAASPSITAPRILL